MNWSNVANFAVAVIAVVLSMVALIRTGKQQKRDSFFRAQELLMAADLQQGRRLLAMAVRAGEMPSSTGDVSLIERAVSNFNTVAILVRLKILPERWMLETWHHVLRDFRSGYELVSSHRRDSKGADVTRRWLDLDALIKSAESYRSRGPCCQAEEKPDKE